MAVATLPPELNAAAARPRHRRGRAALDRWPRRSPAPARACRSSIRPPARSRARSRSPPTPRSTPRSPARRRRCRRWSQTPAGAPRARAGRFPRPPQRAARRAGRAHHRRARQGVQRRPGRGDARHRDRRVRLRHPAAAQGRLHRPGLDRHRQLDPAPAAGRRRRHHAVQLPVHGAVLDVSDRDRLRQHLRAQAERARPVAVDLHGATAGARPACPMACSTSCRATRSRSTRCSSTRTCGAELRRLDADRALHLRDAARSTASACRRSAAPRTTWW